MKQILGLLLACLLCCQTAYSQNRETVLNTTKTEKGANDPMAHQYLEKTRKWMNSCKSLEAYFMACTGEDEQRAFLNCQRGSMLIQGEKYRLTLGKEEYYCNAKEIWSYSHSTQEATVYTYDKSQADMNPFLLVKNYEKYYRAKYIRQENVEGSMRNIIDLTPVTPSEFVKIRLYLDESDARIFRIILYLPQGQLYIYSVTRYRIDPEVSESDFEFAEEKYPGCMLIDMR